MVNLIIEQELPLLCGVDPAYTRKLKALMGILATSVPYELDITKLAGMIGLSRNSVINYLQNLDKWRNCSSYCTRIYYLSKDAKTG